jgi:hypothetical protein
VSGDVLTEIKFWAQIIGDAKRTVVCTPDLESRIKGWVDARGMDGVIKVRATPVCPEGQILIMDEQAMEADLRQSLARMKGFWTY